jgi:hypothetical protein
MGIVEYEESGGATFLAECGETVRINGMGIAAGEIRATGGP